MDLFNSTAVGKNEYEPEAPEVDENEKPGVEESPQADEKKEIDAVEEEAVKPENKSFFDEIE